MANENQAPKELTEEQQKEWVRQQYKTATKYLADKGLITESVTDTDSRYIVPVLAVWKLNLFDKSSVWVICGDLPTDHISIDMASNAKDAIRHFSLKWQMQADNILSSDDVAQKDFANLLISRAEGLYAMTENEKIWEMA